MCVRLLGIWGTASSSMSDTGEVYDIIKVK